RGRRRGRTAHRDVEGAGSDGAECEPTIVFRLICSGDYHLVVAGIAVAKDVHGRRGTVARDADDRRRSVAALARRPVAFAGVVHAVDGFTQGGGQFDGFRIVSQRSTPATDDVGHARILRLKGRDVRGYDQVTPAGNGHIREGEINASAETP